MAEAKPSRTWFSWRAWLRRSAGPVVLALLVGMLPTSGRCGDIRQLTGRVVDLAPVLGADARGRILHEARRHSRSAAAFDKNDRQMRLFPMLRVEPGPARR